MNIKTNNKIFFSLIILAIVILVSTIGLRVIVFDKIGINIVDFSQHFYEMKLHYETNTIPTRGSKFEMSSILDNTRPRVPGGLFYLYYMLCYKLGGEDIETSRIINLIAMMIPICIFLFWVYRRFGIIIFLILSSLTIMNGYYTYTNMIFFNPNLTLALSFLFVPIFAEYVAKQKSPYAAIMIFPLLALMGQGHFAVYYGLVPTVLIYMILRFQHTKKNIIALSISVFLAFLTYLPYLVYELRTNFENIQKAIEYSKTSGLETTMIPFPQIHSLFMFPTNEMSVQYNANKLDLILNFWRNDNPFSFFAFPTMIVSIILTFSILIFVLIRYFKKKQFKYNTNNESDNNISVLKELMTLYILYVPTTILATILGGGISGQFRYHYSIFALSFIPWIYFLYHMIRNKREKVIFSCLIFAIFSTISMFATNYIYYENYQKINLWKNYRDAASSLGNDANGREFSFTDGNSISMEDGMAYNNIGYWNIKEKGIGIIYNIEYKGNNKLDNKYTNGVLIYSNDYYIIHRLD